MNASELFIKALENEGVEYIFGIPGEENLDFLDALRESKIKLILTRHEQGAGFMAATYGRLTGKVGVCLSTLGPGATNFATSAAYAQLGGMPMMMITGQKPIKKSKQGRFQIIDIVRMMRPMTKYTKQVVNGNNIPSMVRESFKIATTERPGAVHIELPEDIAAEEVEFNIYPVQSFKYAVAVDDVIADAVSMIEKAKRPLLLIGAGANRTRIGNALTDFVNKTGIPFFSTQMGKGVVDENHPLCLSTAALSKDDFVHCAIERADLIINVGHDVIEKPPFFMENKPDATKVMHVNFFPSEVDDTYFPQMDVIGDIAGNITKFTDKISKQAHWDFDYYVRLADEIRTRLSKYFGDDRFPILPQRAVRAIRQTLAADDILTLDNGVYKIWFARNYRCAKPNTLLLDNALATMGAGLPSAMAAKMINPDRKVVTVCGDGGFMMNSQEMETAVRLKLDLTVIILNDNAYGMIKWKQTGMGFETFGLDLENPDFVKYAEAYGAKGYRPTSVAEFAETLEKCVNSKGVHLIDLAVDYSLNHSILNELLATKTCLI
ncbi:acetolactate synthase large subunit [Arcobacter lacus]|uniref:Acetolactate synthase large subunit n=1 Tax=Arcobacter lacus TaxID=1912876 RepID=A0ABX5JFH6_9BACT|nr:acetolactate synthase large subunit [Arcobacter lacus]MCT7909284.1 acetolactate synthase large subunit [Arcobacter lacus]MCT7911103.1 acetolactate synthase large subunit [Arcobacter lacus]PUE65243.1 acetolactate synthase large subunit [Arcobacter lacus]